MFDNEGKLKYAYEYNSNKTETLRTIVQPFEGEYRLKDDGRIKIIFTDGKYEITGYGNDYEEFTSQLNDTKGTFSNQLVPEQYSLKYVDEFYLDKNNHDIVLMYMGEKDFKVRMGMKTYDFHKYDV